MIEAYTPMAMSTMCWWNRNTVLVDRAHRQPLEMHIWYYPQDCHVGIRLNHTALFEKMKETQINISQISFTQNQSFDKMKCGFFLFLFLLSNCTIRFWSVSNDNICLYNKKRTFAWFAEFVNYINLMIISNPCGHLLAPSLCIMKSFFDRLLEMQSS